jgi:hypothetical protein
MAKDPGGSGGEALPGYVPHQYDSWVLDASKGSGLPVDVVAAQIDEESGFQPGVTSPAGAEGIAQFEPGTYAGVGGKGSEYVAANELDPYIKLTRENLSWAGGDVRKALAAYNAGQGNWQAGLGYADTILANAKQPGDLNVKPGTGPGVNPNVGKGLGATAASGQNSFADSIAKILSLGAVSAGADIAEGKDPITSVASAIDTLSMPFTKIAEGLDWFFQPSHWIRIFCGVGGAAALGFGIYSMAHVGRGGQVGGSVGGVPVGVDLPSSSLPVAIGATGLGFLGLFVAFHSLPTSVKTFPDFIGYLAGEIRNAGSTSGSSSG